MEEHTSEESSGQKRARDDSGEFEYNSAESKRVNACSYSDPNPPESDRVDTEIKPDPSESNKIHHDSDDNSTESDGCENEFDSPEVMKLREDILDILDEPEMVPEVHDLDSVIRSFEEEIIQSSSSLSHRPVTEPALDSVGSQPDLGYLLEASDDELGLPPAASEAQTQNQPINISAGNEQVNELGNMVGFDDELPSYDSYEFGIGERVTDGNHFGANGNGDFVTVDGLFDYSDGSDFSDLGWRPESLPAL